ncbi:MAG: SDR family oxidoreductase [Pseudomonadota bacterium]
MSADLESAAVLITGAASGIGAATAKRLSDCGRSLVLLDRDGTRLVSLQADLNGPSAVYELDVSDPDAWHNVLENGAIPPLAGAVLCAGVSGAGLVSQMSFQDWRNVLSINLDGAFLGLRAALSVMLDGGAIAVVSSATARKTAAMTSAYGASKAGLEQLVRVTALEVAPRNIRVNAVAPGGVKTPMFTDQAFFADLIEQTGSEAAAWAQLASQTPLGQFAEPEDVAGCLTWLLSDETRLMTGTIVDLDGGYGL